MGSLIWATIESLAIYKNKKKLNISVNTNYINQTFFKALFIGL